MPFRLFKLSRSRPEKQRYFHSPLGVCRTVKSSTAAVVAGSLHPDDKPFSAKLRVCHGLGVSQKIRIAIQGHVTICEPATHIEKLNAKPIGRGCLGPGCLALPMDNVQTISFQNMLSGIMAHHENDQKSARETTGLIVLMPFVPRTSVKHLILYTRHRCWSWDPANN